MTKFLYKISLFTLLLLISCSDDLDYVTDNVVGVGTPIAFTAGVDQTKATRLTDGDFTKFCLYTFYADGSEFFNSTVTRNPADNSCSFDDMDVANPYLWPEDATKAPLNFYGYYPYESLALAKSSDGDRYISYSSALDAKGQKDVVVASLSSDATHSVHLAFDHALSKINFSLTLTNEEVNIRNVKLYYSYKQLSNGGDYNFDAKSWQLDDREDQYSVEFSLAPYSPTASGEKHIYDESLYLLPQSITAANCMAVRVEYDIYNGNELNHTVTTGKLSLANTELVGNAMAEEWLMGHEYTYNLSINTENEISFTLSVDEREEMVAEGNIDLQYVKIVGDATGVDISSMSKRVASLYSAGVTDYVIAGDYNKGAFGYDYTSNPFIVGFGDSYNESEAKYIYGASGDDLISIDLRLMTNLPSFSDIHDASMYGENDLEGTEPSLPTFLFQYAERLKEIMMPEGLVAIGDHAFQGCVNLAKVTMKQVQHVEGFGFQGCIELMEVVGDALTRVHAHGFDNCESLTTINISNVTEVDKYGFVNCKNLGEVDLGKVTIVGEHAFDGCSEMYIKTGKRIPNLATISNYAFAKCAKLGSNTDIVINKAVTIGDHAFNGCSELFLGDDVSEYDLSLVESIGINAFENCTRIDNIDISNISTIGDYAFYGCTNLNFAQNATFSNLTSIGKAAFQNSPSLCSSLKMKIDTPEEMILIGGHAFENCMDFDFEGNTLYNFSGLTAINDAVFANCGELDNPLQFTNPSITSIGEGSFMGCALLPSVTIDPEKVTSIGSNAFYNCGSMSSFELSPSIITSLGDGAFYGCSDMVFNSGADISFDLLTSVEDNTFNGCEALTNSLSFNSEKLTSIGSNAFANSKISSVEGLEGVTSIGEKAFENCSALVGTLSLPNVTSINSYQWNTFYACSSLTSIELGLDESGSIGPGTFQNCTKLESVIGIDHITLLPDYAFLNCSSLKSLDLPKLTALGASAIDGCSGLVSFKAAELNSTIPDAILRGLEYVELGLTGSFGGYGAGTSEDTTSSEDKKGEYSNYTNLKTLRYAKATEVVEGTFLVACPNYETIYLPNVSKVGSSAMKGLSGCSITLGVESSSDLFFGDWVFGDTSEIDLTIAAVGAGSNYSISDNTLTVTHSDGASVDFVFKSITVEG